MQPPHFGAAPTGGGGSPRTDEGTGWRAQRVVRARPSQALFARPPGWRLRTGSRLITCGTMKYDCHSDTRLRGGRGGGHSLPFERVWRFAGIGQRVIRSFVHGS